MENHSDLNCSGATTSRRQKTKRLTFRRCTSKKAPSAWRTVRGHTTSTVFWQSTRRASCRSPMPKTIGAYMTQALSLEPVIQLPFDLQWADKYAQIRPSHVGRFFARSVQLRPFGEPDQLAAFTFNQKVSF